MARQTNQQQPSQATPEQALVTPATRPEVLLALQHQQATQALNGECAAIRQEVGSLDARMIALKTDLTSTSTEVAGIKRVHHIAIGVVAVVSLALGGVWYVVKSKIDTLLMMADERQVFDRHKDDKATLPPAASNSN